MGFWGARSLTSLADRVVAGALGGELPETEIIEDDQVGREPAAKLTLEGVVRRPVPGAGCCSVLEFSEPVDVGDRQAH